MRARSRGAALLLAVLAVVGCDARAAEEGQRRKQAVARLCWVEGRIRNAPNADKASFLAQLAAAACPAPDACQMRDACVSAYGLHVDALGLTAAAKQLMNERRDVEAARILGAAEAKLRDAGPRTERCTALAAELRRTYSVD